MWGLCDGAFSWKRVGDPPHTFGDGAPGLLVLEGGAGPGGAVPRSVDGAEIGRPSRFRPIEQVCEGREASRYLGLKERALTDGKALQPASVELRVCQIGERDFRFLALVGRGFQGRASPTPKGRFIRSSNCLRVSMATFISMHMRR